MEPHKISEYIEAVIQLGGTELRFTLGEYYVVCRRLGKGPKWRHEVYRGLEEICCGISSHYSKLHVDATAPYTPMQRL